MRNVFKFIAKKKWLIISGVFVITALFYYFLRPAGFTNRQQSESQTPGFKEITPGTSTENDLVALLGEPKDKTDTSTGTVYKYSSNSEVRTNDFLITNGTVSLIKEIVTTAKEKSLQDINTKYGTATYTLYGQDAVSGFNLYVIPDKGIAYVANLINNTLLEIWYFKPTTYQNFVSLYAQDYQKTPPVIQ